MVQTRTRSVSDTSALPTHGLGFLVSRSNSAAISGGQAERSDISGCLSSIVRAMTILQCGLDISQLSSAGNGGIERIAQRKHAPRSGGRRLHERAAGGAAAAPG